ncbi:hypothetical protein GJ496_000882 [Pomphorhynchus laevis]|nr:hypothetical protein GJ496_000882 [Pomphorhynchus laevis]
MEALRHYFVSSFNKVFTSITIHPAAGDDKDKPTLIDVAHPSQILQPLSFRMILRCLFRDSLHMTEQNGYEYPLKLVTVYCPLRDSKRH